MAVEPLFRPYTTYEDLCRLPSDGQRYELIDGEVYLTPSPNSQHQRVLLRLARLFQDAAQNPDEIFIAPLDVVLDRATALQPDLIVVLSENQGIVKDVIRGAPDLVAEVLSPSTAEMDRRRKAEAYARYGIREYWILDLAALSIEILRLDPEKKAYRLAATLRLGDRATTPLLPALSVDLAALFRS